MDFARRLFDLFCKLGSLAANCHFVLCAQRLQPTLDVYILNTGTPSIKFLHISTAFIRQFTAHLCQTLLLPLNVDRHM